MGYGCRGESGTFALRRRTAGNLTVEVFLDVGTWSRSVTAFLTVTGLGFGARLPLPVAKRAIGRRPVSRSGMPRRWQKIVDNLAALVAELDKHLRTGDRSDLGAGAGVVQARDVARGRKLGPTTP